MDTRPDFLLSKWYLDCVTATGDTVVVYSASLRWKRIHLHYQAMLLYDDTAGARAVSSFRADSSPAVSGEEIRWSPRYLPFEGTWEGTAGAVERELHRTADGSLRWSCLAPAAHARVRIGNAPPAEGLGYVEQMRLTVPPWRLPLRELQWGRFIAEAHSLVWIGWRGSEDRTLLFHNGRELAGGTITDQSVCAGSANLSLALAERTILREGRLDSTALSMIPGVKNLFPRSILQANECKWRSRGLLTVHGEPPVRGWSIHENVRFP